MDIRHQLSNPAWFFNIFNVMGFDLRVLISDGQNERESIMRVVGQAEMRHCGHRIVERMTLDDGTKRREVTFPSMEFPDGGQIIGVALANSYPGGPIKSIE